MKNRIVLSGALILGVLLMATPASAIVNVLPAGKGEDGFSGKFSTSLTWRTGNTELLQLSGSGNAAYHHADHGVLFKAQVTYGEKGGEPYLHRHFEHIRYRYSVSEWLTAETFLQHQFDEGKRLKFRGLAGLGIAMSWQPLDDFSAVLGSTYLFELEVEGVDEVTIDTMDKYHRWSNYIQLGWDVTETIGLKSTTFVQPRFDDFGDMRILSENGLTVKANDVFGITLSFNASYDSAPFDNVEPLDTNLMTSLDFTF